MEAYFETTNFEADRGGNEKENRDRQIFGGNQGYEILEVAGEGILLGENHGIRNRYANVLGDPQWIFTAIGFLGRGNVTKLSGPGI